MAFEELKQSKPVLIFSPNGNPTLREKMAAFAATKYPEALVQPRCNIAINNPSSQLEKAQGVVVLGENLVNIGRHYRSAGIAVHLFELPAEEEGQQAAGTGLKAENLLTDNQNEGSAVGDVDKTEAGKSDVKTTPVGGRKPPQAAKGKQAKQKQGE